MKQSRAMSLVESASNLAVGLLVSVFANLAILPVFGFAVTARVALEIGGAMTLISLARSYCLRRLFEAIRVKRGISK